MNEILSTLLSRLPARKKSTPSGWISFDAFCCHHNGQSRDKRKRGGILINSQNGFQYHCFNCNYKAGWNPGKLLTSNTKKLFQWLGLDESDIGKLNLFALKIKDSISVNDKENTVSNIEFRQLELPKNCRAINDWILQDPDNQDLAAVIDYIVHVRKMQWDWYNWMWSPEPAYKDRVILPMTYYGKIVGWTGRKINQGVPKYLTDSQPGYVFNIDRQQDSKQYIIVTEGQFDAIAIDGVALMTNEPNDKQIAKINSLNKQVICVPDRDSAGAKMLSHCIKQNWSASSPPWESHIKDVADAVKYYGRLYTLITILHYRVHGEIKLQMLKNKLVSKHA